MTEQEQLITFETAKLAKEKGFKELCFAAFHKDNSGDYSKKGYFESGIISQSEYFKFPTMSNGDKIAVLQKYYIHTILRPTQSLLQKWLRKVHKIYVLPINDLPLPHNSWKCTIEYISPAKTKHVVKKDIYPNIYKGVEESGSFEQAFEAGLQEALKLI